MFTLPKWYSKIKTILNNIKNNNMIIIELGHYQEKRSLNSETPIIIRIIGEDTERDGYWLTQDGESIPEYILEKNYVFLATSYKPEGIKPQLNTSRLFKDFDKIEQTNNDIVQSTSSIEVEKPIQQNNIIVQTPSSREVEKPIQPIIQQEQKFDFNVEVIEKLNINRLNDKNFEKYGEKPFKSQKINLSIEIDFNYDIEKLKQTIELLDLNPESIAKYLALKSNIDLKNIFEKALIDMLLNKKITIVEEKNDLPLIKTNIINDNNHIEIIQKSNIQEFKNDLPQPPFVKPINIELKNQGYSPKIVKHQEQPPLESGTENNQSEENSIDYLINVGIQNIDNFLNNK